MSERYQYIYGPVPSRRLGRSLGIDLAPFKTCTYDCIYCQLGRTTNKTLERREYAENALILDELKRKLQTGDLPHYICLAGSGEPTLHSGIGDLIRSIKHITDIPVAVLTNGSLLWMEEVQDALSAADLVLPSLDAGDETLFRYVNRSHNSISCRKMVNGLIEFTRSMPGRIWLEVFLLGGFTGIRHEVEKIAALVKRINPSRVQLNTVSRPPTEEYAFPISPDQMLAFKSLFKGNVDIISEIPPGCGSSSGLFIAQDEDILALLRRRPCSSADVAAGLGIHVNEALKHLETLINSGKVQSNVSNSQVFYKINPTQGIMI